MRELRLLIVASDPLARAGLASMLADRPGLNLVAQIPADADLDEALEVYLPDVILWDLGWGSDPASDDAALERLSSSAQSGPPVLALLSDESRSADVSAAGARGLLLRDSSAASIQAALTALSEGLMVFGLQLGPPSLPYHQGEQGETLEDLTPRELEVLKLLAEGLPNKTIAFRLGVTEHTVKFHVNAILRKLGAQSRTEAVVRATRLGLILL